MIQEDIIKLAQMLGSGYTITSTGNVNLSCPAAKVSSVHKGDDLHYSFGVKVSYDNSPCHCFACGLEGTISWVIWKLFRDGVLPKYIYDFVNEKDGDIVCRIKNLGVPLIKPVREQSITESFNVEKFVSLCQKNIENASFYLQQRKVSVADVNLYKIGFDTSLQRIVFPIIRKTGAIKACIGRFIENNGYSKYYKYPLWDDTTLFGEHVVDTTKSQAVLVEGPFDVIAIRKILPEYNTLALCGLGISVKAKDRLSNFCNTITLLFDGDNAGVLGAEKVAKNLVNKFRVFIAFLPSGKDPTDITSTELQEILSKKMIF